MKIQLITTYYRASEEERELENLQCLINNVNNPLIEKIHLFLQTNDRPIIKPSDKINFIEHGLRPTFSVLFGFANDIEKDVVKIVANSDIFFNDSLNYIHKALVKWDVLALTRWDLLSNGEFKFFRNYKSQDTWVFKRRIPVDIVGNYFIGQYGCDNRLLYEFKEIGLRIGNPSFSISTIHLHNSGLRNYLQDPNYKYVESPYGYITPHYLSFTTKQFKNKDFIALKYQYYKSVKNNTLFSVHFGLFERFLALIRMKFYAFLSNKLD